MDRQGFLLLLLPIGVLALIIGLAIGSVWLLPQAGVPFWIDACNRIGIATGGTTLILMALRALS